MARTTGFNIQKFYMVLKLLFLCSVWTFTLYKVDVLVLYNRGGECLLRGTL